jgi:hypothetical protein
MKTLFLLVVAAAALLAGSAGAQPPGGNTGWGQDYLVHQWSRGEHIGRDDWKAAARIDYRQVGLSPPPAGCEWREYNGQYILADSHGLIASVVVDKSHHN